MQHRFYWCFFENFYRLLSKIQYPFSILICVLFFVEANYAQQTSSSTITLENNFIRVGIETNKNSINSGAIVEFYDKITHEKIENPKTLLLKFGSKSFHDTYIVKKTRDTLILILKNLPMHSTEAQIQYSLSKKTLVYRVIYIFQIS